MPIQSTGGAMTDKTVYDIRRENLTRLLSERGAKTQLALRLDTTQAHITHMLKPEGQASRAIHEDKARQIETVLGLPPYALDTPAGGPSPRRPAPVVDEALLEESVRVVILAAAEAHATLVADKTAGIVRMVYDNAKPSGRVDPAFVLQLVKLMR